MKPDLIMVQAKSTDFPLWRADLKLNRDLFNKVIIVFMEPNRGIDYSHFIMNAMSEDHVTFLNSPEIKPGEDWRDVAVNAALELVESEWVWFTEPDFIYFNSFWSAVNELHMMDYLGTMVGGRLHPCNILVKKSVLDKTSKDFSAHPELGYDHFGKFQRDLEGLPTKAVYVEEFIQMGSLKIRLWEHLNGLTHNFMLLSDGKAPNYQVERFRGYLEDCLSAEVPLHPEWLSLVSNYLK